MNRSGPWNSELNELNFPCTDVHKLNLWSKNSSKLNLYYFIYHSINRSFDTHYRQVVNNCCRTNKYERYVLEHAIGLHTDLDNDYDDWSSLSKPSVWCQSADYPQDGGWDRYNPFFRPKSYWYKIKMHYKHKYLFCQKFSLIGLSLISYSFVCFVFVLFWFCCTSKLSLVFKWYF